MPHNMLIIKYAYEFHAYKKKNYFPRFMFSFR